MRPPPPAVAAFLACRRVAVAGVSRRADIPANAIFRKLRDAGLEVVPINPHAEELEGARCYPDLAAVPGAIDGLMVATPPSAGPELVRQAAARGIPRIWFHRSLGDGSWSAEAVAECRRLGIEAIEGGCPLMYCAPVDPFHRCLRWCLGLAGRVPG